MCMEAVLSRKLMAGGGGDCVHRKPKGFQGKRADHDRPEGASERRMWQNGGRTTPLSPPITPREARTTPGSNGKKKKEETGERTVPYCKGRRGASVAAKRVGRDWGVSREKTGLPLERVTVKGRAGSCLMHRCVEAKSQPNSPPKG